MKIYKLFLLAVTVMTAASCADKLDLYPHSSASPDGVVLTDLPALRIGMYNEVQVEPGTYTWIGEDLLGGDFMYSQSASAAQTIQTYMTAASGQMSGPWNGIYYALYQVNNVLYICSRFPDDDTAKSISGEAHFFRAFLYMNLVTRYGDVPLLRENTTEKVARTPSATVWEFIDEEITLAESLVSLQKSDYYVSKDAVQALKARVLLYEGKKTQAASEAEALITCGRYALDTPDNIWGTPAGRVEASANKESIFSFSNIATEGGITLGNNFYTYGYINKGGGWYFLTKDFYDSFEDGDTRKTDYVYIDPDAQAAGTPFLYCCNKHRGGQSYPSPIPVFRISEMYLIAAEAKGVAGMSRLNELRSFRGLGPVSASTEAAALDAVLAERRHELVGEGQRWYDLVRTGKFVSTINSPEVQDYHCLFAIPQSQITINDLLVQNPVY